MIHIKNILHVCNKISITPWRNALTFAQMWLQLNFLSSVARFHTTDFPHTPARPSCRPINAMSIEPVLVVAGCSPMPISVLLPLFNDARIKTILLQYQSPFRL
jgi:hypothetical protein